MKIKTLLKPEYPYWAGSYYLKWKDSFVYWTGWRTGIFFFTFNSIRVPTAVPSGSYKSSITRGCICDGPLKSWSRCAVTWIAVDSCSSFKFFLVVACFLPIPLSLISNSIHVSTCFTESSIRFSPSFEDNPCHKAFSTKGWRMSGGTRIVSGFCFPALLL